MWTHEHAADTPLSPAAIWKVLADLDAWARWDTSMERVELLGGDLDLSSVAGKGTTLTVTAPSKRAAEASVDGMGTT